MRLRQPKFIRNSEHTPTSTTIAGRAAVQVAAQRASSAPSGLRRGRPLQRQPAGQTQVERTSGDTIREPVGRHSPSQSRPSSHARPASAVRQLHASRCNIPHRRHTPWHASHSAIARRRVGISTRNAPRHRHSLAPLASSTATSSDASASISRAIRTSRVPTSPGSIAARRKSQSIRAPLLNVPCAERIATTFDVQFRARIESTAEHCETSDSHRASSVSRSRSITTLPSPAVQRATEAATDASATRSGSDNHRGSLSGCASSEGASLDASRDATSIVDDDRAEKSPVETMVCLEAPHAASEAATSAAVELERMSRADSETEAKFSQSGAARSRTRADRESW